MPTLIDKYKNIKREKRKKTCVVKTTSGSRIHGFGPVPVLPLPRDYSYP